MCGGGGLGVDVSPQNKKTNVLCMYGRGTNPDVMKFQMAKLATRLEHYRLHFMSDTHRQCEGCDSTITEMYPSPYYTQVT